MDAAGVGRAAVVGCSMGGGIAIDFALEFPSRVQALVAAAPGVFGLEDIEDDERTVALEKQAGAAMEAGDVLAAVEFELEIWTPASDDPENDRLQHAIAMDNTRAMTADWSKHIRLDPPAGERLDQVAAPTLADPGHPRRGGHGGDHRRGGGAGPRRAQGGHRGRRPPADDAAP